MRTDRCAEARSVSQALRLLLGRRHPFGGPAFPAMSPEASPIPPIGRPGSSALPSSPTLPSDVTLTDEDLAAILNSTNPDLRPLRAHGAKVIHYVGWADSAIAPANSVNYYDSVRAELAGVEPGRQNGDPWEEIQEFYPPFRNKIAAAPGRSILL